MRNALAVFFLLVSIGCQQPVTTSDPSYILKGSILDSATSAPIGSAYMGFKRSDVPDSLLFDGDSLRMSASDSLALLWWSRPDGTFEFDWFLAMRDTSTYQFLFAYKQGYRLWQYSRQPVHIVHINSTTDEATVRLAKR